MNEAARSPTIAAEPEPAPLLMRILIVEDDAALAAALVEAFEDEHHAVDRAEGGREAAELAAISDYDLVVLDWSIPAPTGLELLARWRREGRAFPVLMLTGRGDVEDRVEGLDAGADDYLTKPFAIAELLARSRSLLRRRERRLAPIAAGDLVMDRAARRVTLGGEEVRLTPKEFAVLDILLARRGEAVSREELAEHAWDRNFDAMSNTLDVIVSRVRRKLDPDRDLLETVAGVGWRLRAPETNEPAR